MKHLVCLAILFGVGHNACVAESCWPQFRGPNCSGVSESARPPVAFAPGTNQIWKVAVPEGMSSPVVWRDRFFLTALAAGKLEIHCYARSDGELLWKRIVPSKALEEYHPTEGSPAASSCATDGRRVVSYFGSFGLICHDFDGKEVWRHPLPLAETAGGFGTGSSPTMAGRLVLLNRDLMQGCSLLAVDLRTGQKAWETPRPDVTPSYGSTVVWKTGKTEEIVMSGSLKLKAYDSKTGAERWSLGGLPSFTCTTPVMGDGLLFFAGWSPGKGDSPMPDFEKTAAGHDKNKDGVITREEAKGTGLEPYFRAQDVNGDGKITAEDAAALKANMAKGENVLLAVRPDTKGTAEVVWKQTRGLPYVPSPLYYRGQLYLIKDGGIISCFDGKTGRPAYQQERLKAQGGYYASPVVADGRIIVASLKGRVTVLAAGGERPNALYEADFGERIAATPAMVETQIYIRTATNLYAFAQ